MWGLCSVRVMFCESNVMWELCSVVAMFCGCYVL